MTEEMKAVIEKQDAEIERLRQQNDELVEALKALDYCRGPFPAIAWEKVRAVRAAIDKSTKGKLCQ
jgi:cell division protein FtsB